MSTTIDRLARHILEYLAEDESIITSVNFFLKMPMMNFAVIRYSYVDNSFTYIPEESDSRMIEKPSMSFEFLRQCCEYVRGTSNISIKNHLFVNGTSISIGFYEHFGELINSISYSIIHLIYLYEQAFDTSIFF
jgi:hypothetical protein